MDPLAIPGLAIAAYERVHDLLVTVHDQTHRITARLPSLAIHRHPLCHAAKVPGKQPCLAFDATEVVDVLLRHPEGLVQRCPFGLSEVVVPLRLQGRQVGMLFAGARALGGTEAQRKAPVPDADLPIWTRGEAETALECLRQLAARLDAWLERFGSGPGVRQVGRRERIIAFIERNLNRPLSLPLLARHLGLSEDRTGHAVKEACGIGFVALLTDTRLERAAGLLHFSTLGVAEVSDAVGFGSVSHFHRQFRRRFGRTPLQWRASGGIA